jgi:hypothetical protein
MGECEENQSVVELSLRDGFINAKTDLADKKKDT